MTKEIIIKINPTKKQNTCWKYLKDNKTKFILFGGGAGGGKSWIGCEWLLIQCFLYPGIKLFLGRNELKRIMTSTYITWLKVCNHYHIPKDLWKLNMQQNYIQFVNFKTKKFDEQGSRIDLLDVAYKPSDQLYERFGSMEFTNGWLEEVGEIPERAFDVLKSRIGRHKIDGINMSKMFLTCNPKKNWCYYYFYKPNKEGKLPDNCVFIQSLYSDNPYTAAEYEINLQSIKDPVLKQRLMLGNWEYDDEAGILIEYDKILNMFQRDFDPENMNGEMYITVDVARFGRDKAVIMLWQGLFIKNIWYYDKSKTTYLVEKIKAKMKQHHVDVSNVIVDEDGVGGGVVDMLYGCKGFVNGSKSIEDIDEDTQETTKFSYLNLRSQCYFKLAELINKGEIGVSQNLDSEIRNSLIEELEVIKRKDVEKNEKKLQVISKAEIKELIGRSPDFADSAMMRMYYLLDLQSNTEIAVVW